MIYDNLSMMITVYESQETGGQHETTKGSPPYNQ